jgi:hypothetical protein
MGEIFVTSADLYLLKERFLSLRGLG